MKTPKQNRADDKCDADTRKYAQQDRAAVHYSSLAAKQRSAIHNLLAEQHREPERLFTMWRTVI
ncbi:MAG: hypothetical protein KUG83_06520 [Gammaproteobacteria bacterium]|nr:hypothetical protein [Gammaproteobacteria bacterium]